MNTNLTKESTQEQKTLNKVIKINEVKIQSLLDTMVRNTVEQTLNDLLEMLSQFFAKQRLGLAFVTFIPPAPPTTDSFSFIDPYFFHDITPSYYPLKTGLDQRQSFLPFDDK